jgi:hypothetical protein
MKCTYRLHLRLEFLGFREASKEDFDDILTWLGENVLTHDHDLEHVRDEAYRRFRKINVQPVTPERIEQLIKSAIRIYENRFLLQFTKEYPNHRY